MERNVRNVVIIGSGPAALTAALYNARANLAPLVLAGIKWGGQLMLTTDVENYPGFPDGILGPEVIEKFRQQAVRFGAEIVAEDVTNVDFTRTLPNLPAGKAGASAGQESKPFKVVVGNKTHLAKSVIIATGADTKWLGLESEQRLIGRGVSSCAPCDAFFFKDKKVIVIGGGDSAMEEALTLTKFATDVTIVHRRDEFRASKIMIDRARANKKISFILNSEVVEVLGKDKVSGVKIKSKADGVREIPIDGMFVAIGHLPNTAIFKGQVELDEKGYVKKIENLKLKIKNSYQMMTSVEGVFVAGDVHDYHYRQAVTAAGYGCAAALEAERWLEARE